MSDVKIPVGLCQCGCGQKTRVSVRTNTMRGWEKGKPLKFIHGHNCTGNVKFPSIGKTKESAEYHSWWAMVQRCEYPKSISYPNYGGRGIRIAGKLRSFRGFLEVLGRKPGPEFSLGRINNEGNYEEGNVRWEKRSEQNRNTRANRLTMEKAEGIRADRKTGMTFKQLGSKWGISPGHAHSVAIGKCWA